MKINYAPKMQFSRQGRAALKQDFSDFYYVTSIKLSENPSLVTTGWAKDQRKKIIVAIQSLIDAEDGNLDEDLFQAMKDLCLALHSSYEAVYFLEGLETRIGYQEHNDSFIKKFRT